jgi:hypothetical protein
MRFLCGVDRGISSIGRDCRLRPGLSKGAFSVCDYCLLEGCHNGNVDGNQLIDLKQR